MSALVDFIAGTSVALTLGQNGIPATQPVHVERWNMVGDSIRAEVLFGPYAETIRADAVLVSIAGDEPDALELPKPPGEPEFVLPAGMQFAYTLTLTVTTRQMAV